VLPTAIDASNSEFVENRKQMAVVIASLKDLHLSIERGGPEKARDKHLSRGKMLPRE
jgi:3-methylcrotonyl-CoA carboxylase beta subunit